MPDPRARIRLDLDFHVVAWDDGAERVFGWTAEEAIGESWFLLVSADDDRRGRRDELERNGYVEGIVDYVGKFRPVRAGGKVFAHPGGYVSEFWSEDEFLSLFAGASVPRAATCHLCDGDMSATLRGVTDQKARDCRAVAENLRHFRTTHVPPLTQAELAKAVGVPRTQIVRWENPDRWQPGPESLKMLAAALDVPYWEFYRPREAAAA